MTPQDALLEALLGDLPDAQGQRQARQALLDGADPNGLSQPGWVRCDGEWSLPARAILLGRPHVLEILLAAGAPCCHPDRAPIAVGPTAFPALDLLGLALTVWVRHATQAARVDPTVPLEPLTRCVETVVAHGAPLDRPDPATGITPQQRWAQAVEASVHDPWIRSAEQRFLRLCAALTRGAAVPAAWDTPERPWATHAGALGLRWQTWRAMNRWRAPSTRPSPRL